MTLLITTLYCPIRIAERNIGIIQRTSEKNYRHILIDYKYPGNSSSEIYRLCDRQNLAYADLGKTFREDELRKFLFNYLYDLKFNFYVFHNADSSPMRAGWDEALLNALIMRDVDRSVLASEQTRLDEQSEENKIVNFNGFSYYEKNDFVYSGISAVKKNGLISNPKGKTLIACDYRQRIIKNFEEP